MAETHLKVSSFLSQQGVPRTQPLLVAVSGGADSCALLQILLALGQRVGVAHVHHGLRGSAADADLEFVRVRARALGVPFLFARVDAATRDGRSPEARARGLRYEALARLRERGGYGYVATAHTLDDQAETVLLRALRGTGPRGLAGIAPHSATGRLLRPLLSVRREELRCYLRERGLAWREDETNADASIPRNRLRIDVLPVLEAIHPAAVRKLGDLAQSSRETALFLRDAVAPTLARALEARDGGVWIDPAPLAELPLSLRTQAAMELLERQGLAERISSTHLGRMLRFLEHAEAGKRLSLPRATTLLCDRDRFWLGPEPGPQFPRPFSCELRPPHALELPERDLRLSWRRMSARDSGREALRLPTQLSRPLVVRSPVPGDHMRPLEKAHTVPLQALFRAARWSRRARARAVVVELASEVIWVVGSAHLPLAHTACHELDSSGWGLVAEPLSSHLESC